MKIGRLSWSRPNPDPSRVRSPPPPPRPPGQAGYTPVGGADRPSEAPPRPPDRPLRPPPPPPRRISGHITVERVATRGRRQWGARVSGYDGMWQARTPERALARARRVTDAELVRRMLADSGRITIEAD